MPTIKKRNRIPKTAKEMLKIVGKFLAKNNDQSAAVWDVLSALRGPDSQSIADKQATTEVIRFHLLNKARGFQGGTLHKDDPNRAENRRNMKTTNHFENHAYRAFVTLGLKWDDVNK